MKLFAILCIVAGALLIFLSNDSSTYAGYIKIVGFIMLMFGLYRCTKFWVQENPRDKKDDSDEQEDVSRKN